MTFWQQIWQWISPATDELSAVKCVRLLRQCSSLQESKAIDLIEHLEMLTGHPDIATYLHDNQWRMAMPRAVVRDIMAEVRLLQQLTDDEN